MRVPFLYNVAPSIILDIITEYAHGFIHAVVPQSEASLARSGAPASTRAGLIGRGTKLVRNTSNCGTLAWHATIPSYGRNCNSRRDSMQMAWYGGAKYRFLNRPT